MIKIGLDEKQLALLNFLHHAITEFNRLFYEWFFNIAITFLFWLCCKYSENSTWDMIMLGFLCYPALMSTIRMVFLSMTIGKLKRTVKHWEFQVSE